MSVDRQASFEKWLNGKVVTKDENGQLNIHRENHHKCHPDCICPVDAWWRCFQHWYNCPAASNKEK